MDYTPYPPGYGYNPYAAGYGQDVDTMQDAFAEQGRQQIKELERRFKLDADALKQRMEIARLQSGDSRYGVDATRETQLAQIALAREEMERVNIPRVAIEKWVAEKNDEVARLELGFKREQWEDQLGLQRGELTGLYGGDPTLAYRKLMLDQEEMGRRYGLDVGRETGYLDGRSTLGREQMEGELGLRRDELGLRERELGMTGEERDRRYAFDVGKFGAELSSTPDTYYQAQRFASQDLPGLLGMAGGPAPSGGPMPQIGRMGEWLGPGMPGSGAPPTGPLPHGPMPTPGGGTDLSPQEQARWEQLMARNDQILASGGPGLEGVDLDEAQRFKARGATWTSPTAGGEPMLGIDPVAPDPYAGYGGAASYKGGGGGGGMQGGYFGRDPGGAPYRTSPIDGGTYTPWTPTGGWRPEDLEERVMIDDPGFSPGFDPGARLRAGGSDQADLAGSWEDRYGIRGGAGPSMGGVPSMSVSDPSGGMMRLNTSSSGRSGPQPATRYGGSSPGSSYRMPAASTAGSARSSSTQADPRTRQVGQIARAVPPSPYDGLNDTDSAALRLMESIYKQGGRSMDPGNYARMKATGRTGFLKSAGRMLGYDPNDLDADYQAYRPTQGSARMA